MGGTTTRNCSKHEAEMEDKVEALQNGQTFVRSFGHWSANGGFVLEKDWCLSLTRLIKLLKSSTYIGSDIPWRL